MGISTAIDPNARASIVGIQTKFLNTGPRGRFLQQRVGVIGQGATAITYDTTKKEFLSAFDVGTEYGFGSPVHLAAKKLIPANGDGISGIPMTIYPLADDASGVAAAGDITPSGTQTISKSYRVSINNILSAEFVIAPSALVEEITAAITTAINSNLDMPMIASATVTEVNLTSKWKGESANDLSIEIIESEGDSGGTIFTITQPAGGLINPDVDAALNQVGNVWETMFLNCLNISDTTTLDKFKTFGDGRWLPTVKKPTIFFSGDTQADVMSATTISDARKSEFINGQLVAPGSKELPFLVAARQLARILLQAEINPPTGYNGLIADGLGAGTDAEQWDYDERDYAVKHGSSTSTLENEEVTLGDIITFYHPDGDPVPAYRKVVNIVKLQNIIYNLDLIFEDVKWRDAPLIPDDEDTINPNAKKPAMAKAEVNGLIDFLGAWAFISNAEEAKTQTIAQINDVNPNRLDVILFVKLSGNTNIKSIDLNFSYFTGGQ